MSRPQVTITLGRSGQVVKRPGAVSDSSPSDFGQSSGSKRSIRDRLGSNVDNSSTKSKRQRREGDQRSNASFGDKDGVRVNKDDLRYKLIRKNMNRRTWGNGEQSNKDLREKLSRTAQPKMRTNTRQQVNETKSNGTMKQIPPTRSADDLLNMDSMRKSYSAWTLDGLRRSSPDRILGVSRHLSPPRNMVDLRHASSSRHADAVRPSSFTSKDVFDSSRAPSLLTKASVPSDPAKAVVRFPPPNTSGMMQKSSYAGEEPLTVSSLLHSLGLGKYAILFQAEEVDMTALRQMGDNDLKELGIPMGPRKKILLAVLSRPRRQP